ncbi:MAG: cytochrome c-type biogenesis protein CcmH [Pseudohongiellaceae bacterium]|jgi:cytochrome c-type biogenesis protein CcmH
MRHFHIQLCLVFILMTFGDSNMAIAQVDTFKFDTLEQQQRFRKLSDELRCPMCQNTNLSGSTGGVAEDLRREIHRMIVEGLTDADIEKFMFDRYGDFIFYKPRLRAETAFLWFAPLLFLILGFAAGYMVWRNSKLSVHKSASLDVGQINRLNDLLDSKQ